MKMTGGGHDSEAGPLRPFPKSAHRATRCHGRGFFAGRRTGSEDASRRRRFPESICCPLSSHLRAYAEDLCTRSIGADRESRSRPVVSGCRSWAGAHRVGNRHIDRAQPQQRSAGHELSVRCSSISLTSARRPERTSRMLRHKRGLGRRPQIFGRQADRPSSGSLSRSSSVAQSAAIGPPCRRSGPHGPVDASVGKNAEPSGTKKALGASVTPCRTRHRGARFPR